MDKETLDIAMQQLDNAYKTMRTYIARTNELKRILDTCENFHDDSVSSINDALEHSTANMVKYANLTQNYIAMLTDEEGLTL